MMSVKKQLNMVHLQLTKNCNLRCHFCGQWGENGFLSKQSACEELSFSQWQQVVDDLVAYRDATGISPDMILWGGEPLVSPCFEEITRLLQHHNFNLGLITNGVLLNHYADLINDAFKTVYISLDGPAAIHDSIRGQGVFKQVESNILAIPDRRFKLVLMSVMFPGNIDLMATLPLDFAHLQPDSVILHKQIYLNQKEIAEYSNWLTTCFQQPAETISSWQQDDTSHYELNWKIQSTKVKQFIQSNRYPMAVSVLAHGNATPGHHCQSPFQHMHITYDGKILFCTDFYDFSAGNVKQDKPLAIFNNARSERFRQEIIDGNCPTCDHCSWRNNDLYRLD